MFKVPTLRFSFLCGSTCATTSTCALSIRSSPSSAPWDHLSLTGQPSSTSAGSPSILPSSCCPAYKRSTFSGYSSSSALRFASSGIMSLRTTVVMAMSPKPRLKRMKRHLSSQMEPLLTAMRRMATQRPMDPQRRNEPAPRSLPGWGFQTS